MIVLGIDPGARYVGIAVRDVSRRANAPEALLAWETLDRRAIGYDVSTVDAWAHVVLEAVTDLDVEHNADLVAVEAATAPSPHLGMTNPAGIIEAAVLVGAMLGRFGVSTVLVDQAGHGSPVPKGATAALGRRILEQSYPAELIGARETTGRGKSPRQHARAAFDVAGAARPR